MMFDRCKIVFNNKNICEKAKESLDIMEYRCKTSENEKLGQTDLGFAR
jgi:hypothetical protein